MSGREEERDRVKDEWEGGRERRSEEGAREGGRERRGEEVKEEEREG